MDKCLVQTNRTHFVIHWLQNEKKCFVNVNVFAKAVKCLTVCSSKCYKASRLWWRWLFVIPGQPCGEGPVGFL